MNRNDWQIFKYTVRNIIEYHVYLYMKLNFSVYLLISFCFGIGSASSHFIYLKLSIVVIKNVKRT